MERVAMVSEVTVAELVCVSFTRQGPSDEPSRSVCQYWTKDGRMLAEHDFYFHSPDVAVFRVLELVAQVKALQAEVKALKAETKDRAEVVDAL